MKYFANKFMSPQTLIILIFFHRNLLILKSTVFIISYECMSIRALIPILKRKMTSSSCICIHLQ